MIVPPEEIRGPVEERADAVVIGSGAGGAVVAKELAEAGLSVVVLEEGGHFTVKDFNRRPADMVPLLYRDSGSTTALGRPAIPIPLGKTVGGTTTINSGTCFRTPAKVLDSWTKPPHGLEKAGPDDIAPFYERVEKVINVIPVKKELWGRNALVVRRGADALGYHHGPLLRNVNDRCRGCGVCCFGCPSDAKMAMHLSYLPRAVSAGARIYSHCRAERVLVENGKAIGVGGTLLSPHDSRDAFPIEVRAQAVILAAGTLMSPLFLLKNRICNSSGEVGRNLTIHPASRVAALMDEDVWGWRGVPQGYMIDEFADEGIMMEGVQGPPALIGPALPFLGERFAELLKDIRRIATFGAMVSDTSAGTVRVERGWRPLILYQINEYDTRRIVKAIALMSKVFLAAGAKRVFPAVHSHPEVRTMAEADALMNAPVRPDEIELVAFHPLGTCRMGFDPRSSVVDSWCQSHDLGNFYIIDGSIFPSSLGVNPQLTIMAFATRAAFRLADRLRS